MYLWIQHMKVRWRHGTKEIFSLLGLWTSKKYWVWRHLSYKEKILVSWIRTHFEFKCWLMIFRHEMNSIKEILSSAMYVIPLWQKRITYIELFLWKKELYHLSCACTIICIILNCIFCLTTDVYLLKSFEMG